MLTNTGSFQDTIVNTENLRFDTGLSITASQIEQLAFVPSLFVLFVFCAFRIFYLGNNTVSVVDEVRELLQENRSESHIPIFFSNCEVIQQIVPVQANEECVPENNILT